MQKRGKRGQFYIIGAAVIITIILGLTAAVNKASVTPKYTKFFDISENFEKESIKVIDYGVYNPAIDIQQKVYDFYSNYTQNYAVPTDPDIWISYIYGNSSFAQVGDLNVSEGATHLTAKDWYADFESSTYKIPFSYTVIGEETVVMLENSTYTFTLTPKENFYFVIMTKKGGEVLVSSKKA